MVNKAIEHLQQELKEKDKTISYIIKSLQAKTKECEKYEQTLNSIVTTIKDLENENILTFPDFSTEENYKMIIGQCNSGYVHILDIIKTIDE